jgi:outer membrane receptor for ferrienterochelin and colicin
VVNFRPSYTFGNAKLYLTGKYYDERFSDDANNVTLPDYFVFGAGARYQLGPTTLQVTGSNLFNEVGLTEGNPRTGQVVGVQRDIFSARPILGRRFTASIRYNF